MSIAPESHIVFTVTNDLSYDQRMHRICNSLSKAGYLITLVGRELPSSIPLSDEQYLQKRVRCFFNKGSLFYAEYNLRLFFYLLSFKMNCICAIDLDTILPVLFVSGLKGVKRIYDAHEYFTELKEVRSRPLVHGAWSMIEKIAVPKYDYGYTVSEGLADEFRKKYNRKYAVIRNLPVLSNLNIKEREKVIVFQGAVNEARGFEVLIPAMKEINYKLIVCGDGNFMEKLKELIASNNVSHKVELKGMLLPSELRDIAEVSSLGIGLAEKEGVNQYFALPNKFLEYIHAGLPQVTMNFPEYKKINDQYKVAVLLDSLSPSNVATTINAVMEDEELLKELRMNTLIAREVLCWQKEEELLLKFYTRLPVE